jgi:hypothetical protein
MPIWIKAIIGVFDTIRNAFVYPLIALGVINLCFDAPTYLKRIAIALEKIAKQK